MDFISLDTLDDVKRDFATWRASRPNKKDYYWITEKVIKAINWPQGPKVISTLEGGYNLEFLGEAVLKHLQGMVNNEHYRIYRNLPLFISIHKHSCCSCCEP
jgi:acetoin utilization deacetylase AcuC-like enzyme